MAGPLSVFRQAAVLLLTALFYSASMASVR